jgi:hypothetical protein
MRDGNASINNDTWQENFRQVSLFIFIYTLQLALQNQLWT